MGGKFFIKNPKCKGIVIETRMTPEEYNALCRLIMDTLAIVLVEIFNPLNFKFSLSSVYKQDYGDIDLVAYVTDERLINVIINALQPDENLRGKSDSHHLLISGRQVDIKFVNSYELLHSTIFFTAYSSVSTILGKMIIRLDQELGITNNAIVLNENGLFITTAIENKKKRYFLLTNNVDIILHWLSRENDRLTYDEFLQLQHMPEESVAEFLARTRFFSSDIFKDLVVSKNNPKETIHRIRHMITYSQSNPGIISNEKITREELLRFFNKTQEYIQDEADYNEFLLKEEKFKNRFNGDRLKLFFPEKSFKEIMIKFKDLKVNNEFGYSMDFVDEILSLSEGEELDNFIKSYEI